MTENIGKKTICCIRLLITSAVLLLCAAFFPGESKGIEQSDTISYTEYLSTVPQNAGEGTVIVNAEDADGGTEIKTDGKLSRQIAEGETVSVSFVAPKAGLYAVRLYYCPLGSAGGTIKTELYLDGSLPFQEASGIKLSRIWEEDPEYDLDWQGNQIKRAAIEHPMWTEEVLTAASGVSGDGLKLYLTEGTHTISLYFWQGSVSFGSITLFSAGGMQSYGEYIEKNDGYEKAHDSIRIEAESIKYKSDRSIVTVNDRTSPVTFPDGGTKIVFNTIGGSNYKTAGQWIEWEIDVPESGLYTMVFRFRQNEKNEMTVYRALSIDGEIPFAEAASIAFPYDRGWQTMALGKDGSPYLFCLSAGKHRIRLTVTLGEYAQAIGRINDLMSELNKIYTGIVMVTGSNPDTDRDYQFEKIMPGIIEDISAAKRHVDKEEKKLQDIGSEKGGENTAGLRRLSILLDRMQEDPESIAKRLSRFLSEITSLGSWINSSREQPLLLDYLMLSDPSAEVPDDSAGFFETIFFHIKQFFYSYATNYTDIGNRSAVSDEKITVWIGSGRDQADIVRKLVNDRFTAEYGIAVNVQLVTAGALTPATLSGEGPDVYLGIAQDQPVEYALRNAVADLRSFDDIDEVLERFYPASLESFELDGAVYALPATMSYPMLFYRKDILSDIGVDEEDLTTWDRLLQNVLPELDVNGFDFGLTSSTSMFGSFINQYGGSFYNEDDTACMFASPEGISAFEKITSMYTDYGIPKAYDFANRFRSGQMPLAVADYTAYNQLSLFAPEIDGMWSMLPLPGVEQNGTVNNTAVCTVTGNVILNNSQNKDAAWTFLKWWTSDDVQTEYAAQLEIVMGTGARYASANIAAMQSVDWAKNIREALLAQQKSLIGYPCIAGGYYTARNYDFAFRAVVYEGKNLREMLRDAADSITKEIRSKRKEFYGE